MRIRGLCRCTRPDDSGAAQSGEAGCRAGARPEGLRGILERSVQRPGAGGGHITFGSGSVLLALTILTLTSPALASTPGPRPTPGAARIVTNFVLDGRVTVADNIRGEHVGQRVTRIWTFTPTCATGACQTIKLVRTRAAGTDRVTLRRRAPGYYVGSGSFFAPLRCGSSTYAKGAAVPFTITVRVTAVTLFGSAVVATEISATYTNSSRTNLTPCVAALGHDAARYRGHLMRAPGSGGSQGLSARSPEGS